ncbi:MAG TPA: hypothetical protein VMR62_05790 [Bryobacteraceae bacterium]|jgi:hypothetical protein|nr:hypothetical protein [Bryobacteraceae bacterium]
MEETDVQAIVKQTIQEVLDEQQAKSEPAYKTELMEERRRREQLERRLGEVEEESKRSRQVAEQAERSATIRAELQRLGVAKVDLAYRAVQDGVFRAEDGRLLGHGDAGEVPLKEYLSNFVSENPEFLPARIAGGSGITGAHKAPRESSESVNIDGIRPGMSSDEMERVRKEILRVAGQNLRGI